MLQTLTGDMFVTIIPIEPLLRHGVSMSDYGAFLETNSGLKFFKEECKLVLLRHGAALWVPWGFLAVPLYWGAAADKDHRTGYALPLFDGSLARKVSMATLTAIANYNVRYGRSQTSSAWIERTSFLTTFFKDIGVNLDP